MSISSSIHYQAPEANPLDAVEQMVSANEWVFERISGEEIAVEVPGRWCGYSLYFVWRPDVGALHFTCGFDIKIPEAKRPGLYELLGLINEKLWIGHFALWPEEGLPMFRHALLVKGGPGVTSEQVECLIETALNESDRFYPAFQFLVWGGKSPSEALDCALIETVGEA